MLTTIFPRRPENPGLGDETRFRVTLLKSIFATIRGVLNLSCYGQKKKRKERKNQCGSKGRIARRRKDTSAANATAILDFLEVILSSMSGSSESREATDAVLEEG